MIQRVMLRTILAGVLCFGATAAGATTAGQTSPPQPHRQAGVDRGTYEQIRRLVARHRRKGIDVDDCVQDVCVALLQARAKVVDGSADRWLTTVARNKAVDGVRRRYRRSTAPLSEAVADRLTGREPDPSAECERSEVRQQVRDAMRRLRQIASERSYRVLHLRHVEGLSVAEVGQRLNLTPGQVWAREHRMKRKLRELLSRSVA